MLVRAQSLALFLLALSPSVISVSDRRCGTDTSKLWLDVVFVIDNSAGMNMYKVFDTIQAVFNPSVQVGTGYDDPRSTRVGFITYNYNATDVADFYKLQSFSDLSSQINRLSITPMARTVASYMDNGITAASRMINSTTGFRDNYKKMVVIFTSSYGHRTNSPKDLSQKLLKSRGITVVTVNTGSDRNVNSNLQDVASPGLSFAMTDGNTTMEIVKAMTDTNCYCPRGWTQYSWPIYTSANRFGTCVQSGGASFATTRDSAKSMCRQSDSKAYLVNELDQQKRSFNFAFINSVSSGVNAFYNGLLNINGAWFWDQPDNTPLIALDPNSGSPPPRNGCVADIKYSDGTTSWTPVSCGTQFQFICEMKTCDTDHYCLYL